jgi:hypothetical protein
MKFKTLGLILAGCALLAGAGTASAQYFTPGDLVVSTYGSLTGTNVVTDGSTAITLVEYSLDASGSTSYVLADQLPTSGVNGQVGIDGEDGSSSEGTLQLSGNGEYLTIAGYDGNAAANGIQAATNTANGTSFAPGTAWGASTVAMAQSSDVDVPRVVATIDSNGNVDTSTTFTGPYNTNNPRSVYSPDGTNFYISGQGSGTKVGSVYTDEGGIFTTTLGTTGNSNTTAIYTAVSTRDVLEYGGNLYYSADQNSKKGIQTGIFQYTGTPTTSQGSNTGTRLTPVSGTIYAGGGMAPSGTGTSVNFSPEDFAFANSSTLYVADTGDPKAGGVGDGGIQKWTLTSPNTWTLDYTLAPSNFLSPSLATGATPASVGETGFEDLALTVSGNNVDIYAVSYTVGADAEANGLYDVVDSLSNLSPTVAETETVNELETSPGIDGSTANYNFKGVSFAPTPAAVPEPGAWGMVIGGLSLMLLINRKHRLL